MIGGSETVAIQAEAAQCPKCKLPMQPLTHRGVALFYCLECKGLWFDGNEVVQVIGDAEARPFKENLAGPRSRATPLPCPRGHGMLREVTLELAAFHRAVVRRRLEAAAAA